MTQITEESPIHLARDERSLFIDQLAILTENWRFFVITAFVVFLVGVAYAYVASPVFRVDATIQVEANGPSDSERDRERMGALEEVFNSGAKTTADTEIELLRSRVVLADAVRKLDLEIDATPRYFPVFGTWWAARSKPGTLATPVAALSQYAWGGEKIDVSHFDVPRSLEGTQFTLVTGDNDRFSLFDPEGTELATGSVGQPLHAATTAGPITLNVERLIARPGCEFHLTRSSTLETVTGLQDALFITEKTKDTGVVSVSLEGHDPKRIARIVDTVADEYIRQNIQRRSAEAQHSLNFLQEQLPVLRVELERSEERYNEYRNSKGTVDLSEEGKLLVKQAADNRSKTIALEQQRAEATQHFTPSSPSVTAIDEQIAVLEQEQRILAQHVALLPNTEQAALRLERDVRVNSQLYTNLLDSAQQLRVIEAGQIGSARLVDRAEVPEKPIKPNRRFILCVAALLALLSGAGAVHARAAIRERADRSVEIERLSGVPVFAVVPRSAREANIQRSVRRGREVERVLAVDTPQDGAVESLRRLRTALEGAMPGAPGGGNIVMITGTRPGAGKSFLSVNFAAVSAVATRRVLLVDGDMRCGVLHTYFGLPYRTGLADALAGAEMRGLIVHEVMPGVDLLTRGLLSAAPDDLLLRGTTRGIFDELASDYDIVIVDTPPVLAVTDATLLGKFAKTTLLVVRQERRAIEEIAEANKRLRQADVTLSGILVTDVRHTSFGYTSDYAKYHAYPSSARSPA